MTGFAFNRVRLARYLIPVAVAVLCLAVLLLTLAAGGADEGVARATKGDGSGRSPVVGKVVSISGKTAGITVKSPGGREQRLRERDQLHLSDVIDPDQGVEATLRLKVPNGVSGNTELVYIAPGKGDNHTITMERTSKLETTVVIGD